MLLVNQFGEKIGNQGCNYSTENFENLIFNEFFNWQKKILGKYTSNSFDLSVVRKTSFKLEKINAQRLFCKEIDRLVKLYQFCDEQVYSFVERNSGLPYREHIFDGIKRMLNDGFLDSSLLAIYTAHDSVEEFVDILKELYQEGKRPILGNSFDNNSDFYRQPLFPIYPSRDSSIFDLFEEDIGDDQTKKSFPIKSEIDYLILSKILFPNNDLLSEFELGGVINLTNITHEDLPPLNKIHKLEQVLSSGYAHDIIAKIYDVNTNTKDLHNLSERAQKNKLEQINCIEVVLMEEYNNDEFEEHFKPVLYVGLEPMREVLLKRIREYKDTF